MNRFAWSITFEWSIDVSSLKVSHVLTDVRENVSNLFVVWETNLSSSEEVVAMFSSLINWKLLWRDISITTEDDIEFRDYLALRWNWFIWSKYEMTAIHWKTMAEVMVTISDMALVTTVREAETSHIDWWKVIKIDQVVFPSSKQA